MQRALTLYSTSIGKKVAMALSGGILTGFTIGHFLGNLNLYKGQEAFNGYAETLAGMPALLWGTRIAVGFSLLVHVATYTQLAIRTLRARPNRYAKRRWLEADLPSRSMYYSGPALLFFILFHLAHMTFPKTSFGLYAWIENDPYNNLVHGLQNPIIATLYILGNVFLGLHLFHGIYSAFQSLGWNHPKYNHLRRDLATGLATLVMIGNLSFPIAVQVGWVQPSDATAVPTFDGGGTVPPIPGILGQ